MHIYISIILVSSLSMFYFSVKFFKEASEKLRNIHFLLMSVYLLLFNLTKALEEEEEQTVSQQDDSKQKDAPRTVDKKSPLKAEDYLFSGI
jgi:hypothetical protein